MNKFRTLHSYHEKEVIVLFKNGEIVKGEFQLIDDTQARFMISSTQYYVDRVQDIKMKDSDKEFPNWQKIWEKMES